MLSQLSAPDSSVGQQEAGRDVFDPGGAELPSALLSLDNGGTNLTRGAACIALDMPLSCGGCKPWYLAGNLRLRDATMTS